ncbi:chitin synthase III catalytic subunit-domain-containing protein [Favolaschia claudopus]|uniref:Chitin synthase export chaperone n=1 Tax=Favolaschia claudopus TaxID=2862362 RepID=A0AAW0D5W8_9AGAR
MGQYDMVVGVLLIGLFFNTYLYGISTYQFVVYVRARFKDSLWIRSIVGSLFFLDTIHTAVGIYSAWDTCVTNYANTAALACKVFLLTQSKPLFAFIIALSVLGFVFGCIAGVRSGLINEAAKQYLLRPYVTAWLALQTGSDLIITLCLTVALTRSKTSFRNTNTIINRLIGGAIRTGLFASIFALADLFSFLLHRNTNLYAMFAYPLGRVYTNTLLHTLNSRTSMKRHETANMRMSTQNLPSVTHMSAGAVYIRRDVITDSVDVHSEMGIQFGSFNSVCETAALVICPLVGTDTGIEPSCYSRNVDIGGTLIFQPSTCFVHIVAIIMTAIMILHIRSKYTAVGRKEIVTFFWMYAVIELLAIFLDSGIIPTSNAAYTWFAAIYTGLVAAAYACILINGFVGFQFAEDGTPLSLWFLRISCLVVFAVSFFVAIATFKKFAGFNYTKPVGLWIVYLLWPLLCVIIYVVSQLVLVFRTLDDRWAVGGIVFGVLFFAAAQILMFGFSVTICNAIKHYIDGLFFFTLCMLLSVMMVYKYWDSITREDLEFSVGSKAAVWEVKDPLLAGSGPEFGGPGQSHLPGMAHQNYSEEDTASNFHSGAPASLVGGVSGAQMYGNGGGYNPYQQQQQMRGRAYPPTNQPGY